MDIRIVHEIVGGVMLLVAGGISLMARVTPLTSRWGRLAAQWTGQGGPVHRKRRAQGLFAAAFALYGVSALAQAASQATAPDTSYHLLLVTKGIAILIAVVTVATGSRRA